MKRNQKIWIAVFLLPTLLLFSLFYMAPLFTVLVTSFARWNGFEPLKWVGFKNYQDIFFKDSTFRSAFGNTLLWGAIAALIHVPFGVYVALVLHRKPIGWRFVRSVAMIPNIISTAVMAILYVFIFNPGMGLLNGFIKLLGFKNFEVNWFFDTSTAFASVTATWVFFAGVIILITMAELSAISPSIYEAAKIDGATSFQIDLLINLPLLKGIIGTSIILAVTSAFRAFDIIYLTTAGGPGDKTTNIALMIYNEVAINYRNGYANALGTILLIMGILVILLVNYLFRLSKPSTE